MYISDFNLLIKNQNKCVRMAKSELSKNGNAFEPGLTNTTLFFLLLQI